MFDSFRKRPNPEPAPADDVPEPLPEQTPAPWEITGSVLSLDDLRSLPRVAFEQACRVRAQPLYLGGRTALGRVLGRYKMYFDTRDEGFAAHVLLDGYWEAWLTQLIAQRVRPGMRVADVGANFGYYSLLMADLVGVDGLMIAVEPASRTAELLRRSLALNGFAGRSQVLQAAASDRPGEGRLLVPVGEPKNAALVDMAGSAAMEGVEDVPLVRLDDVLGGERMDFLKIDAEGAEESIVVGLSTTIARSAPEMIIEFNPHRCRDPGGFLEILRATYPTLRKLELGGDILPVDETALLNDADLEDRLLFLTQADLSQ